MPLFGGVAVEEEVSFKGVEEALLEALVAGLEIAGADKEAADSSRFEVEASAASHAVIASRIEALRTPGTPVTVECLIAPVAALDRAAPAWRTEGPFLDGQVFARALTDPHSRLLAACTRTGRSAFAAERGIEPLVASIEVNQSGVIPVGNPIVEVPLSGDRLEVRASLVPGSDLLWIEAALARIRVDTRKKDMGPVLGEMDLPAFDETLASLGLLAPPGRTVIAAAHAGRGTVLLLRVEPAKATGAGPPPAAADRVTRVHDLSPLIQEPASPWPRDLLAGGAPPAFAHRSLPELLGLEGQADWTAARVPGSGKVLLTAAADLQASTERRLAEIVRQAAEVFAIEIDVAAVEKTLFEELRGALADGVLADETRIEKPGARERRRYLVTGSSGRWHAVREARLGTYVSDSYLVSGGTGQELVIAQGPEVATAGSGIELRVRADRVPGAERLRLQVEGASARVTGERRVRLGAGFRGVQDEGPAPGAATTALPGYRSLPLFPGEAPGDVPEPAAGPELLLPRQVVRYWDAEREVPEGRWAVLHLEADGEAGTLVLARARAAR
jgi:hypothetical protein